VTCKKRVTGKKGDRKWVKEKGHSDPERSEGEESPSLFSN